MMTIIQSCFYRVGVSEFASILIFSPRNFEFWQNILGFDTGYTCIYTKFSFFSFHTYLVFATAKSSETPHMIRNKETKSPRGNKDGKKSTRHTTRCIDKHLCNDLMEDIITSMMSTWALWSCSGGNTDIKPGPFISGGPLSVSLTVLHVSRFVPVIIWSFRWHFVPGDLGHHYQFYSINSHIFRFHCFIRNNMLYVCYAYTCKCKTQLPVPFVI